jgi:GT2 family glycosyltransferase
LDQLRAAVDSVVAQDYRYWELCLCDDGTRQPELTRYLHAICGSNTRIRFVSHPSNRGIAAATNQAILLADGDYVAFMDQDDLLAPNALSEIAQVLRDRPAKLIYTDEDRIDAHGCHVEPIFKPDWSPDLLLSRMYLGHLCVYRRPFLHQIGMLRSEFDGTQDYELALRATSQTSQIVHIPKVLYHWRIGGNSAGAAFNLQCHERGRKAIAETLKRQCQAATVADGPTSCTFHVRYRHAELPLVSILIPTRDNPDLLRRCLRSIRRKTKYGRYEILVIDNGSRKPEMLNLLNTCGERVLRLDMPFNHSRLNNLAAAEARGSLLLLLNDDTEAITSEWLTAMVEQAQRPEIGAVGAWLFQPDGRTQHAGIVLGLGAVATPLHSGILRDGLDRGTVGLIRDVSAVTGACLMMRRQLYFDIGGLDEDALPASFNDVDMCLRLRKSGFRIVQTPLARLYHHESASRTIGDERRYVQMMHERWANELRRDPFWNPNLPHGAEGNPSMAFHWEPEQLDSISTAAASIECTSEEPSSEGASHEPTATCADRRPMASHGESQDLSSL